MAVTLKEIAERAGVSTFTVSRVLSGQAEEARISPARASAVRAIARELNFRPNAAARAMRLRKTKHVGVLIRNRPGYSRHTHPLAFETILGINEGLQSVGYVLSIIRVGDVVEANKSRVFQEHVLDGMIVIDAMPDAVVEQIDARLPKNVWVDSSVWRDRGCIRRDERSAGRMVANALLDLGYREWLWVGLGPGPERNYSLAERYAGVREVAEANNIELHEAAVAAGKAQDFEPDVMKLLRPDVGVIAYGIYQARAIQSVAASMNINPPYGFGLVCCDDSHDTRRLWPGLCRASFDRFSMGYEAARMMIEMLKDDGATMPSQRIEPMYCVGNTAWGPRS